MKYINPSACIKNQYPAKVRGYQFAIDFMITVGSHKIGIECDGRQFHSVEKDEWRDKLILGAGIVDSMVRLRGTDINFRLPDALYVMAVWYPGLFSGRGVDNIEKLTTSTAKRTDIYMLGAHFKYRTDIAMIGDDEEIDDPIDDEFSEGFGDLFITRRLPE
jgi:hypothetical protein